MEIPVGPRISKYTLLVMKCPIFIHPSFNVHLFRANFPLSEAFESGMSCMIFAEHTSNYKEIQCTFRNKTKKPKNCRFTQKVWKNDACWFFFSRKKLILWLFEWNIFSALQFVINLRLCTWKNRISSRIIDNVRNENKKLCRSFTLLVLCIFKRERKNRLHQIWTEIQKLREEIF